MKRIISITIALCLIFCSVLPVYAEAWSNNQADSVTRNVQALVTAFTGSVGTMYNSISELMSWLTPVGSFSSSHSITGVTLYEIIDYIAWTLTGVGPTVYDTFTSMASMLSHLPSIDTFANSIASTLTSNGTNLGSPYFVYRQNFVPYSTPTAYSINTNSLSILNRDTNGQVSVGWPNRNPTSLKQLLLIMANNNMLQFSSIYSIGTKYIRSAYDKFTGSGLTQQDPYTYLSLMDLLYDSVDSIHLIDKFYWHTLQHYGDNLSTWDSQGSTLTQVGFTPDSAIQGLYRYLAFTQRDVARLAYVFANDEELEARELAQANQEQVLDDFIDPTGTGAVSTTNLGSMADASGSFKDNFDTGQSASGIWNVFDRDYDWFSQTTANNLQPSLTRGSEEYSTPYLDEYYKELDSILEVNKRD